MRVPGTGARAVWYRCPELTTHCVLVIQQLLQQQLLLRCECWRLGWSCSGARRRRCRASPGSTMQVQLPQGQQGSAAGATTSCCCCAAVFVCGGLQHLCAEKGRGGTARKATAAVNCVQDLDHHRIMQ